MFNRDKRKEKIESERKKTEEFNKRRKEVNFEKGDTWALIIAALTTILPLAIITFILLWLLVAVIFRFVG
ncbi:MAG TPA: hypothetical protein VFC83_01085 [Erysipelotrichaceae bacterium]|nr:hypothetical protein [Erysipelotrichaceae bacterium]